MQVRVLCWVMTTPASHASKAVHVKATWGAHCDSLLFVSTKSDPQLGRVIALNLTEGRQTLWGKTKQGFQGSSFNNNDKFI